MNSRHRFRPWNLDALETRVVLSSAHVGRLAKAAVQQTRLQTAIANINRSFDSFTSDYIQAQSTYLAANASVKAPATNFPMAQFQTLVKGRVDLLAQELTQSMSKIPGSLARPKGQQNPPLISFLRNRISGMGPNSLKTALTGTNSLVVPPPTAEGASVTLYTIQAQNAIEAARAATINSATFINNGTFTNKSHH